MVDSYGVARSLCCVARNSIGVTVPGVWLVKNSNMTGASTMMVVALAGV
jgi:hypothetical protein